MGELSHSREYLSFRSSVPLKKVCVDGGTNKDWTIYDIGSKNIRCPLICLPPVSGRADIFFRQMLALSAAGSRVISVEYPAVWTCKEFCEGFTRLLDHLHLDRVHLFGASLGGFLAQKFAEHVCRVHRVQSIILCNAFIDTDIFDQSLAAPTYWMLPAVVLKRMLLGNYERGNLDREVSDGVDFVVDCLDSLGQRDLAARLTLNCRSAAVETRRLSGLPITIMDVNDCSALSPAVKETVYKAYPNARRAHLKTGGNFPYLSRSDEVNLHIQIHLRQFDRTKYSAQDNTEADDDTAGQLVSETCIDDSCATVSV
jgi:maspardin